MKYDVATPYTAAFVLLVRDGKIASLLRSGTGWMDNHYGLPAGKIEHNESAKAAAVREAKEEVGVTIEQSDLQHSLTMHRKGTDGTVWVDFYCTPKQWEGEPYNAEPDVHSELAWFDPKDLPENTIGAVRCALEQIAAGETYAEYGWVSGQQD